MDSFKFQLKLETPEVRQKFAAWTEKSRQNQNVTANELLESFNTIFNEVASENKPTSSLRGRNRS